MESRIDEIADQIFRIAVWTDKAPITFNQFIIRDACPTLIHTGHASLFDIIRRQAERVLDLRTLRYIGFSHVEADECGALNHWLALAPQADVLCGPIAARTSVGDFAVRPPRSIADNEVIELGARRLQMLDPPPFPSQLGCRRLVRGIQRHSVWLGSRYPQWPTPAVNRGGPQRGNHCLTTAFRLHAHRTARVSCSGTSPTASDWLPGGHARVGVAGIGPRHVVQCPGAGVRSRSWGLSITVRLLRTPHHRFWPVDDLTTGGGFFLAAAAW